MQHTKRWLVFIACLFKAAIVLQAQSIPESAIKKIDSLFKKWNNSTTPGFVVGIVINDSLVFSKGYGMANLEHRVPITPNTRFYIASVSKQFTGYSIILLARQGKIKMEEDIRTYLPWLADFGKKITVNNLIHHTSGIRDHLNMIAISGLGIDGMLTNERALHILKMQRSLAFNPGERYSYSNSNYILLAEIVKAVSGKSLKEFADSAIFMPLSMTNSRFQHNPSQLVENRAFSYWATDNGNYTNAFQNVYTVGDGGLFTTVHDMAKWIMNFYNPRVGDFQDIEQLTKKGKLNNGRQQSYAAGITVTENKGWKMYSHAGGLHGYSSVVSVYPDLKMGFILFGNIRDGSILSKVNELADLFIVAKTEKPARAHQATNSSKGFLKDSDFLKKYMGNYISEDGYLLDITWKENKLVGTGFGQTFTLIGKVQKDTFLFPSKNNPSTRIVFGGNRVGEDFGFDLVFPDEILHFTKYNKSATLQFKDLAGKYYCPELECSYEIVLRNQELFLTSNKYPDSKLTVIGDSHLKRDSWYMYHLKIIRDQNSKISGFEVNSGNVMHLRFDKIE